MSGWERQIQQQKHQQPITRVFCWGSRAGGSLGHSLPSQRGLELLPIPAPCLPLNVSSPASSVSAGYRTSTVVLDDGRCFSWGVGVGGGGPRHAVRAGNHSISTLIRLPKKIPAVNLEHGNNHACAVMADGSLWSWGECSEGRLGLGNEKRRGMVTIPKRVLSTNKNKKYTQVGCGEHHTLALVEDGSMVGFGANNAGQLGIGNEQKKVKLSWKGIKVYCSAKISFVACGNNHSAAVSDGGILFTWGWGENGRLGHGDEEARSRPEKVDSLLSEGHTITKVSCGSSHTCVISEDGDILGFGWNMYGQVGLRERTSHKDDDEMEISHLSPVMCLRGKMATNVSCGFAHTAATTASGNLYVWGFNEEGQLGLGHEQSVDQPSIVDFTEEKYTKYVLAVSCGHTHTMCVTSDMSACDAKQNNHHQGESFIDMELQLMEIEDEISRECQLQEKKIREEQERGRWNTLEASRMEWEMNQMKREDATARAQAECIRRERAQEEARIRRNRAKQKEANRNAKLKERTQREADRLFQARKKREMIGKAKVMLPKIRRVTRKKDKIKNQQCAGQVSGESTKEGGKEKKQNMRNMMLIRNRRNRLQEKDRLQREEEERKQRILNQERMEAEKEQKLTERRLSQQRKEKERIFRERRQRASAELDRLRYDLGLVKDSVDCGDEPMLPPVVDKQKFMTASQWGKILCCTNPYLQN